MKILVVEDDNGVAEMVKSGLSSDGHVVETADDGAEGSFLAKSYEYDAIVLDYSLPKKDGLKVCEEVRAYGRLTPILFLSIVGDIPVKVSALNGGADDYMTKPFSMDELRARVRALARRPATTLIPSGLALLDLTLDPEKQQVHRAGRLIRLTKKEFCLLEYLMRHTGTIMSRAMIMEHVWTADGNLMSNTVEAHVRNLRRKINSKRKPDLITNIAGRGYVMDTPENLKKFMPVK